MKVLKFGGTSVGCVKNMSMVKDIICDGETKIIVLSAMSGTTNALLKIDAHLQKHEKKEAIQIINELYGKYEAVVSELYEKEKYEILGSNYIDETFDYLSALVEKSYEPIFNKILVAQGELLSTNLFTFYLQENGENAILIPALEFMQKDVNGEPLLQIISQKIKKHLKNGIQLYVTQGFICLNEKDEIDNLDRGGSDYTASIIGAVIKAEEIQIWTDIDGFHNNDPRVVEKTRRIPQLSFDEAAELAYFGAKILHPLTILPAREKNIPVLLKNTMQPSAEGTLIIEKSIADGIKAIAAKDGITAIKIQSVRMFQAYGFLQKVFEIFANNKTSIDMITTSQIDVSLTIDDTKNLAKIVTELSVFSDVKVDENQTIICVVGQNIVHDSHAKEIFTVLKDMDVRMICYGGSDNNISLLINEKDKKTAMQNLNRYVFDF